MSNLFPTSLNCPGHQDPFDFQQDQDASGNPGLHFPVMPVFASRDLEQPTRILTRSTNRLPRTSKQVPNPSMSHRKEPVPGSREIGFRGIGEEMP